MNQDIIQGHWKQIKGKVQEQWGKLTDDDIQQISGKKEQLVGKLQVRYGYSKEKAQQIVNDFESKISSEEHWEEEHVGSVPRRGVESSESSVHQTGSGQQRRGVNEGVKG